MVSGAAIAPAASAPYRHPGGFPTGLTFDSEDGSNQVDILSKDVRPIGEDKDFMLHVFVDPFTFRFLEDGRGFVCYQRDQVLEGYSLWIVEQWILSRNEPTYLVVTRTGNPQDRIPVNIARIPRDRRLWSPQLKFYFAKMEEIGAGAIRTELGTVYSTVLAKLNEKINLIPVPDGNILKHRVEFIVNEDLKQLKCTGRACISLQPASDATRAKFLQLYRTSDKIPFSTAVQELVRVVQVALHMSGKLKKSYIDGLICQRTEKAIAEWWSDFGEDFGMADLHSHEGVSLGPSTVATILGLYMGARNRLAVLGEAVPKDAFDMGQLKTAIAHFQKTQKIQVEPDHPVHRLDKETMKRLHELTNKTVKKQNSNNIGPFAFPRAFKSTVADLSGKPREAGIAAIETQDMETFVHYVYGDYAKFLWYGKPLKNRPAKEIKRQQHQSPESIKATSSEFDREVVANTSQYTDSRNGSPFQQASKLSKPSIPTVTLQHSGSSDPLRRAVFRNMTGRNVESSSRDNHEQGHHGFRDKIKDAVSSSRRHRQKNSVNPSRDDGRDSEAGESFQNRNSLDQDLLRRSSFRNSPQNSSNKLQESRDSPRNSQNAISNSRLAPPVNKKAPSFENPTTSTSTLDMINTPGSFPSHQDLLEHQQRENARSASIKSTPQENRPHALSRAQSASRLHVLNSTRNDAFYPRRMSYSLAEEVLSTAPGLLSSTPNPQYSTSPTSGAPNTRFDPRQTTDSISSQNQSDGDFDITWENSQQRFHDITEWTSNEISHFRSLDNNLGDTLDALKKLRAEYQRNFEIITKTVQDAVQSGVVPLKDNIRDVEGMAARLQYEISSLRSKVNEVDDAVSSFDAGVARIEDKAARGGFDINSGGESDKGGADADQSRKGWLGWGMGLLRKSPQITPPETQALTSQSGDPQKLQNPHDYRRPQTTEKYSSVAARHEDAPAGEESYFANGKRGHGDIRDVGRRNQNVKGEYRRNEDDGSDRGVESSGPRQRRPEKRDENDRRDFHRQDSRRQEVRAVSEDRRGQIR